MNFKLLKKLSETSGVSGFEDPVRDIFREEIKPFVDDIKVDVMGNLIAHKKGEGRKPLKIMIAAHMDEIGYMVTHIDDNGFLRLDKLGGVYLPAQMSRQIVINGKKQILGVIGARPLSAMSDDAKKKLPEMEEIFADTGLPVSEVRKLVEIGTPVTIREECLEIGDLVTGKAMDDRVGVYCMIEVARKLKKSPFDIYFVGTVQEEVGYRGAITCAHALNPDIGIALDVTHAGDVPGVAAHKQIAKLGAGTAIKLKDSNVISHPKLIRAFRKLGDRNKIPYQLEVLPSGGTDSGAIQRNQSGAIAGTLSIPTRYVHSTVESCHIKDIQATINLLSAFLESSQEF